MSEAWGDLLNAILTFLTDIAEEQEDGTAVFYDAESESLVLAAQGEFVSKLVETLRAGGVTVEE